ncbi:hypothetical protein XI04_26865 [Bradyrhizobium sp. CCBAU 11430]|nr:hypothetical protein [Bradyrhizobium sp. CCBAU 25360]MDA9516649.1 hypothetical protein [Bradyrhizobium sp. CCBAU 11430]
MKPLVKAKSEPGLCLRDEPVPMIGPTDQLIRLKKTRDLRYGFIFSAGMSGLAKPCLCPWWWAMSSRAKELISARPFKALHAASVRREKAM